MEMTDNTRLTWGSIKLHINDFMFKGQKDKSQLPSKAHETFSSLCGSNPPLPSPTTPALLSLQQFSPQPLDHGTAVLALLHGEISFPFPAWRIPTHPSRVSSNDTSSSVTFQKEVRPSQLFAYTYILASIRSQYCLISCYLSLRLDLEKLVFNCKLRSFLLGKLAITYSFWIPPA